MATNIYDHKTRIRLEASPETGFNAVPIDDRIPEKWIDLINENRTKHKIGPLPIAQKTGIARDRLNQYLRKKQYCSYANYWLIVQAIAEILAEREER